VLETDVVVVGAGPSGATTALLLARQGHKVVVVDRARFPRDKACGEGPCQRFGLYIESLASQSTPGRVIIVVTDGNETSSKAGLQDVIAVANKARVSIYVVAIESRSFTPTPLKELAARTGGKYYAAASAGFLRKIYANIADELSRTWQIGYLTTMRPGQKLDVSASVPGQGSASASVVLSGTDTVTGSKQTRECAYAKLLSTNFSPDGTCTLAVSNRQKPTVVHYGSSLSGSFEFRLDLALAHYRGAVAPFAAQLQSELADLDANRPALPTPPAR